MQVTLHDRIADARARKKLSLRALAKRVGVSHVAVSSWEYGTDPGASHIPALARALGVEIEWLLTGRAVRP